MPKHYDPCPRCGRKGVYEMRDYTGNLPDGSRCCRYCHQTFLPEEETDPAILTERAKTPLPRRKKLCKAELLLALAVKTEVWASQVTDDCSWAIPFAQWPPDDPFRKLCKTYGLSPTDFAKVMREIGDELERRAMRAGYDDSWVGVAGEAADIDRGDINEK